MDREGHQGGGDSGLGSGAMALLTLVVIFLFLPSLSFAFLTMDDAGYVFENPRVYTGLSWDNLRFAFFSLHSGISYWHPVTWISHQLDCQLFGLRPGPHHATNVLLHAANTLLVAAWCARLRLARGAVFFVALIFAVHPLHVESVAWIAERKDLLAGAFYLGTMILFVDYLRGRDKGTYLLCVGCALLAMMSKPTAVTIPAALWLVERTLDISKAGDSNVLRPPRLSVLGWVPFAIPAIVTAALTLVAQRQIGSIVPLASLPLSDRLDNSWLSYLTYGFRFLFPSGLCAAYGQEPGSRPWAMLALAPLAVITYLLGRHRRRLPIAWLGWLLFLTLLAPTIGIVQSGPQSSADRYMYLPLIGLTLIVVDVSRRASHRWPRLPLPFAAAVATVALSATTVQQLGFWRDSVTVFTRAVDVQPNHWYARLGLGGALAAAGRHDEALIQLRRALELPGNAGEAHRLMGICYLAKKDPPQALRHFEFSYTVRPAVAVACLLVRIYS
ncbi:MAG: tetratricopeptide repeat protein, partial [Nitrospira sp.]|nr:tetratricopeptide repeat protein [Nitrospira sp.]